jgi:FKBP-type peptidyl-prolyl cis-trans isomerase
MTNSIKPLIVGFLVLLSACSEAQTEEPKGQEQKPSQEQLIDKNRELLEQERKRITEFIEANKFEMKQTGSGMYYMFLKDSSYTGDFRFTEGDQIKYHYRITLLDGTPIANSKDDGTRVITINKDNTHIGLHEAFMLMTIGDEMLLILPSHLAYGISHNEDDVPPRSTIIYELKPIEKLN